MRHELSKVNGTCERFASSWAMFGNIFKFVLIRLSGSVVKLSLLVCVSLKNEFELVECQGPLAGI